jgi:hypothetical protein
MTASGTPPAEWTKTGRDRDGDSLWVVSYLESSAEDLRQPRVARAAPHLSRSIADRFGNVDRYRFKPFIWPAALNGLDTLVSALARVSMLAGRTRRRGLEGGLPEAEPEPLPDVAASWPLECAAGGIAC